MTTHRCRECCASPAITGPGGRARLLFFLPFVASLFFAASSEGQQRQSSGLPAPRILQVSPAGAKAGTTVEITVAGKHVEEPEKLVFSTPGIKAELVPTPPPPIDPKTKKPKAKTPAPSPELVKYKVTVPAGTPLGHHDVRLVNKWGVSNPRTFVVGDLNEAAEKEPNNDIDQAQRVEMNSTVNGTMSAAADVDYYVFPAKKGQRVVVSCLASGIDSRFTPALEVYNQKDSQIAANRNYSGTDAVADFTAPEDGDYLVRLYQFTHVLAQAIPGNMPAGSSDHYYRLSVSTAPWIDAVHPAVVEPGKTTSVTVYGRNLPGGKLDPSAVSDDTVLEKVTVSVNPPADAKGKLTFSGHVGPAAGWLDGFELRLKNASGSSNPYLLGLTKLPVTLEAVNNDSADSAQEVTLPCEVAGQVEKRRDRDWFTFTAKKGESWNVEVFSNRLGAPTYMTIHVRNPATKSEIYESPLVDNTQRYPQKFYSRSEDPPVYRFTAPADGKYQLLVASRAGDTLFGPRHTYAVRISREEQDFQLVALGGTDPSPDTATVPGGGQDAFTVISDRSGDFAGDIELTVEGLPAGVTCVPQTIGGAVNKTTLVVSANAGAAPWAGEIRVKGTAVINGTKVVREARAAGVVWPLNANDTNTPALSRVERGLWMSVRGKAPFTLAPTIDKAELFQGDKATVKVKVNRLWPELKNPIQVSLMQPQNRQGTQFPNNLRFNNNQPVNVAAGQAEGTLAVTVAADVAPGVYNVVFRGQTQIPYNKDPMAKAKPNTPIAQPSAPLKVTVLPKSLAQLTLSTTNPTVKIGGQAEVAVRVQRRYGFAGEFKVKVEIPGGAKGVEVAEATIPANQNEAKLVVKAQAGTTPGNRANLVVKATALWNGKTPTVHEAKFNVNVVK